MNDDKKIDPKWFCPDGAKHRWKDLRSKNKTAGPPFFFYQRCKRCNAIKVQTVTVTTKENGDVIPTISTNIEQGDNFWTLQSPDEKK